MKLETTQKVEMQVGLIAIRLSVFVLFSWLWIGWNYAEREEAFFQIWLLAPFMELSSILVSFLPTRFWKSKKVMEQQWSSKWLLSVPTVW